MDIQVIEKSRKLLTQMMSDEDFDKFIKDEKIEIIHKLGDNETVYELDLDGRVFNRTKQQSYCIEPLCDSNLPIYDLLAIKYSYLKNNIKRVEEVANKRSTAPYRHPGIPDVENNVGFLGGLRMRLAGTGDTDIDLGTRIHRYGAILDRPRSAGYSQYIEYLEGMGWRRSQITLSEHNTRIVTVNDVINSNMLPNKNSNGQVVEIRCPAGQRMSIMGTQQISMGSDARIAHPLRARFADEEDNEIPYSTCISIRKEKTTEAIIQIARLFYADVNLTFEPEGSSPDRPLESLRLKTDDQQYRFRQGIELNGGDRLKLYAINCESNIIARNCRFALDCDLWSM